MQQPAICVDIVSQFSALMGQFLNLSSSSANTFSHTNGFQPTQPNPLQQTQTEGVGMETLTIGFLFTLFIGLIFMSYLNRDHEDLTNIKEQNRRVHRGGPQNGGPGGPGPEGGIY